MNYDDYERMRKADEYRESVDSNLFPADRMEEIPVGYMAPGTIRWSVPWALDVDVHGKAFIRESSTAYASKGGAVSMKIERDDSGDFHVTVPDGESYRPTDWSTHGSVPVTTVNGAKAVPEEMLEYCLKDMPGGVEMWGSVGTLGIDNHRKCWLFDYAPMSYHRSHNSDVRVLRDGGGFHVKYPYDVDYIPGELDHRYTTPVASLQDNAEEVQRRVEKEEAEDKARRDRAAQHLRDLDTAAAEAVRVADDMPTPAQAALPATPRSQWTPW